MRLAAGNRGEVLASPSKRRPAVRSRTSRPERELRPPLPLQRWRLSLGGSLQPLSGRGQTNCGTDDAVTDRLTPSRRSWLMARVRGAHTKPEWILRCGLHRLGFRYRLGGRGLPGRPDLVLRRYRTVIFVHGCFWHRHTGCRRASRPSSNVAFWDAKFARNLARDKANRLALMRLGWSVVVVWECELYSDPLGVVKQVASRLRPADSESSSYSSAVADIDNGTLIRIAEGRVRYRLGPGRNADA